LLSHVFWLFSTLMVVLQQLSEHGVEWRLKNQTKNKTQLAPINNRILRLT
jgi:hypothetical protein